MRFTNYYKASLLLIAFFPLSILGQIGIGTTTPNSSALLEISSQTQGVLTPRMTTAQREAINSPAHGLLVFDTDLNSFEYYSTSTTSWEKMSSKTRDNFVLVKSQADFPAVSGGSISLDENTYYEINGTVTLSASINLNGAYISGLDAAEDVLSYPGGIIFKGTAGGSIRNVTLTGAKAFEINGPGISTSSSLLLQNTTITGMTTSVGSVANIGLFFGNVVQFVNNTNGATYSNIGNLLLNNQAWFGNNQGTYEKLTGNFGLIEKVSGFSNVISGSSLGFDPTGVIGITGSAVIENVVFYGGGDYIKSTNTYTGFNFTKDWTVNCTNIPAESDNVAGGNFYYNGNLTTGFSQTISNNNAVKITGGDSSTNSTTGNSLFRFTAPSNNKLVYDGTKKRNFQINASLSVRGDVSGEYFAFIIAKKGNVITESNAIVRIENSSNIQNVSLNAIALLSSDDYIEIYTQRLVGSGNTSLSVFSENLSIN